MNLGDEYSLQLPVNIMFETVITLAFFAEIKIIII
jgi:hypothetical protein